MSSVVRSSTPPADRPGDHRSRLPTSLACRGCGYRAPDDHPIVFACPSAQAGDDIDHVLVRHLDPARIAFPAGGEANPFLRYRTLFHGYHVARTAGWSDATYVALVERLDAAVADVDGRGFVVTPFAPSAELGERLGFAQGGGVFVKDETGNVSGSHKARHLMGTLLELEAADAHRGARKPGTSGGREKPTLAIASCGNAALAAAVVARAAGRLLDVFIPIHADPAVVTRLRDLGARLIVCEREPGVSGDPTYHRLLRAIEGGAVAFTCQGNLNGLAIEGGETIGHEIVGQLARTGAHLDRIFVQVGGGALASSVVQALLDARLLGVLDRLPRIHAVQTRGGHPLARAWDLVAERVRVRPRGRPADRSGAGATDLPSDLADPAVADELAYAAHHRSAFMWPWEVEPQSIASGILDDETYDWFAVVRGMLATGGHPVIVDEATLVEAHRMARSATGVDVDPTGSSGLAGLVDLVRRGEVGRHETVAVLFTGITRSERSAARRAESPQSRGGGA
jgi:threonine synthase